MGCLHITNMKGQQVGMKKIYYDWANVALKAKRAIGSSVIIETGRSGDTNSVFRDIYTSGMVSWALTSSTSRMTQVTKASRSCCGHVVVSSS